MKDNNPFFRKNLTILTVKNPELGSMIERHRPSGEFHPRDTPAHTPTLLHIPPTGAPRYIHSPEDPVQEAMDLIRDHEFRGEDITMLFGFGMGYLPLAIMDRMHSEHVLFIAESNLDILHKTFHKIDLSVLLRDERVHLINTGQSTLLLSTLDRYSLKIVAGKVRPLIYPPCIELDPESYKTFEMKAEQFIRLKGNNYSSMYENEESSTENTFNNLMFLENAAPINKLKGFSAGRPIIVVAAGPSLDGNIRKLAKCKGKAIIIAVDTALKALIAADILPDMVVSTESRDYNFVKFKSISETILDRITPIFALYAYHEIPKLFTRNRFFFNEGGALNTWFLEMEPPVVRLPKGNSVGLYAFYLARFMSPSQIIFIGLDLSFPIKEAHSKDSAQTWNIHAGTKFNMIPDSKGGMVETIPAFRDTITIFEAQVAGTDIPCIDATEGGALIPGTRVMTMQEAIDRYIDQHEITQFSFGEKWEQAPETDFQTLDRKLSWFKTEAMDVETLSRQGDTAVAALMGLIDSHGLNNEDVHKGISKVNKLTDKIDSHELYMALIKQRLDSVHIAQYRAQFRAERENDPQRRLLIQLEATKEYFSRINQATTILLRCLDKVSVDDSRNVID